MANRSRIKARTKKLDKIFRELIIQRDDSICQRCGKKVTGHNCQVHHIIPKRGYPELRHDLMNGICLCYRHHHVDKESPHQNAIFFSEWLKEHKFEQWDYLVPYLNIPKNHKPHIE